MTATLIAQINVSLDGYIENDDHEIDWQFVDAEYDEFILQTLRSLDAMVFGRKAYEPLSQYWPTAADNPDATPVDVEQARLMHELPKYVVSTMLSKTDWHNTHILHDVSDSRRSRHATTVPSRSSPAAGSSPLPAISG